MIKTVNVTEAHIKEGKRVECRSCPIALALLEIFPGKTVSVDGARAVIYEQPTEEQKLYHKRIYGPETERHYGTWFSDATLPVAANRWVYNFDKTDKDPTRTPVEPITFDLTFYPEVSQ